MKLKAFSSVIMLITYGILSVFSFGLAIFFCIYSKNNPNIFPLSIIVLAAKMISFVFEIYFIANDIKETRKEKAIYQGIYADGLPILIEEKNIVSENEYNNATSKPVINS